MVQFRFAKPDGSFESMRVDFFVTLKYSNLSIFRHLYRHSPSDLCPFAPLVGLGVEVRHGPGHFGWANRLSQASLSQQPQRKTFDCRFVGSARHEIVPYGNRSMDGTVFNQSTFLGMAPCCMLWRGLHVQGSDCQEQCRRHGEEAEFEKTPGTDEVAFASQGREP